MNLLEYVPELRWEKGEFTNETVSHYDVNYVLGLANVELWLICTLILEINSVPNTAISCIYLSGIYIVVHTYEKIPAPGLGHFLFPGRHRRRTYGTDFSR